MLMTKEELLSALRRMTVPDRHQCLGCGYEHSCGIHGCAVIKAAIQWIEVAEAPNGPLTLDELRQMDREPVWVEFPKCPEATGWMLVDVTRHCVYNGLLGDFDFGNCGKTWLAYRGKPEEGK